MTQDEIIELAKSINEDWWLDDIDLQAFAKLVAEEEREVCAKIIDDSYETTTPGQGIPEDWLLTLSEAIRARGQA